MKGAMGPNDFGLTHRPEVWAVYANMSEAVENDPQVIKMNSQQPNAAPASGNVFNITRPPDGSAPAQVAAN